MKNHVFHLFYEVLTEYEILEVAKILVEVYGSISTDIPKGQFSEDDEPAGLNCPEEFSGEFVGAVIDLDASALHKLLLLTSAEWFMSNRCVEYVVNLAKVKKEIRFDTNEIVTNRNLYNLMKQFYILPGVAPRTFSHKASLELQPGRTSIEVFSRLTAFIANKFEDVTLGEHLELPFSEGVATQKTLTGFAQPNKIQNVLISRYKDLANSMTAREVVSLSFILNNSMSEVDLPLSILLNRSRAMEQNVWPISRYENDSVIRYLSKVEQKALSSLTVIEHLNELVKARDMKAQTQPIVYAALAEVLSVKGERKAIEIALMLDHLRLSNDRNLKMYEATIAIIDLALKPESDSLPFGWAAQLSEHAWVFNSHLQENELFEVSL